MKDKTETAKELLTAVMEARPYILFDNCKGHLDSPFLESFVSAEFLRLFLLLKLELAHTYEIRPCKDHRAVDLISDALPFGRLWHDTPDNAISYAMHCSSSHDAVIRHEAGNLIETHEHVGDFKEP